MIRRFYKEAAVEAAAEGFAVALDGKRIKTPGGTPLIVHRPSLAEAIAAEWAAQGEKIEPRAMPITQLAATALDRVAPLGGALIGELVKYGETDLLCYRAEAPADLAARQESVWQPLLDWAAFRLGAPLSVAKGIQPVRQPPESIAALRRRLEQFDIWHLSAAQSATATLGSLILALALAEERLTADEAFAAAQLDETYQIELWGEDAEATTRRAALLADVRAAQQFFEHCRRA